VNYKRKSRRRFFLLMCSRTPPISSEFRGGFEHPKPPPSVRHCLVCFMQLRKTQRSVGVCDTVIVVFILLWKLKFLAYFLNVTQRFIMRIISYANFVYFAVGNVRPLPKLLHCRVHGMAQRRKRKMLQVSKESRAVCS